MGKQVQVAMLEQDEFSFLTYLRSTANIRVYRSSAPTAEALVVKDFSGTEEQCHQFFVWNTAFVWEPLVRHVPLDAPVTEKRGWAYLGNTGTAPVLEYDRHNFEQEHSGGRIYWAKFFMASSELSYDVAAFERWYDDVARWIRKQGRRMKSERYGMYYLPQAWATHGNAL